MDDWYYNKNCRPLDIHKYSYFKQVTQCIDNLAEDIELYNNFFFLDELKKHLTVVVVDLYHMWFYVEFNGGIGYSRDKNKYKLRSRYNKLRIKREPLIHTINCLIENEFIVQKKGYKSYDYGVNTKIRATPKLIDYIKEFNVDPDMIWKGEQEIIVLKDKKGGKLEYNDNQYTIKIREELLMYIDKLVKHKITHINKKFIKLDTIDIHRVFQNDFKHGGRIYGGFWQSKVRSEERKNILIDNQKTIELDYTNQNIKILYALEGTDYFGDAYTIPNYDRKLVKKAMICAINCRSKESAIRAIQKEINMDGYLHKYWLKNRPNIGLLLDQLEFEHQEIEKYFYTCVGMSCQRIDSEICIKIINEFVKQGKVVLTIHDSFVVKEEDKEFLKNTMLNKFNEVLNTRMDNPDTLIH